MNLRRKSVDSRGVPVLKGAGAIPSWFDIAMSLIMLSLLWIAVVEPTSGWRRQEMGWKDFGGLGFFLLVSVWGFRDGIKKIVLRRRIDRLTPEREAAERFGVSSETLERIAAANGVKPRYNIYATDYYDLRDFGDFSLLLRPANPPEAIALLKPVGAYQPDQEALLRATNGDAGQSHGTGGTI